MPSFERCDPPEPGELWADHTPKLLRKHVVAQVLGNLLSHFEHWGRVFQDAERNVDLAREDLAGMLVNAIARSTNEIREKLTDAEATYKTRSKAVYGGVVVTAMSSLCAAILPQRPGETRDGAGLGYANTIPEFNRDEAGYAVARLHMPPGHCDSYFEDSRDQPIVWYRDTDMYIRREPEPSRPDDRLVAHLAERNVKVNFAELEMLTPYARYTV